MLPMEKLKEIKKRFGFVEAQMATGGDDIVRLGREYAELRPIVDQIHKYESTLDEIKHAREMLEDAELRKLAEEELFGLKSKKTELESALQKMLVPRDEADERSAIVEIRPGTGGEEAALFAGDLMKMYEHFSLGKGWSFDVMQSSETELGGIREVIANVRGKGVFERLKFESGVHRVQRVPETESGGRIHTSAATVAVLPEATDVDIKIASKDIRTDTMRSSGAGGQHVNKTDSAVRITHLPTGIVVTSSQKSQHRNREIAMQVLMARLYDLERAREHQKRASKRASQVGSGDRSERIRTYNYPQGRVTDHRINLTLYKLDQFMHGDLDEVIDALAANAQAELLAQFDR
ncbi:MAG: peptide chain release factor 1 [Roseovarius sp.]|nr:peptide chain release factor 1 [Roseovarius sp.]